MAVADTLSNSASIDSYIDLTLSLSTANWADSNGKDFYIILEVTEHGELAQ